MQRGTPATTTPNGNNAQAPVVYRSLPIAAASPLLTSPSAITSKQQQPQQQQPVAVSPEAEARRDQAAADDIEQKCADITAIPFPPVPVSGLHNGAIWKDDVDLGAIHELLVSTCSACELRRTRDACEFRCTAQAEDGNEQCNFTLNLWQVPPGEEGAMGKYLIQVDRCAGCPYFFKQIIAKTFDVPMDAKRPQYFRVPKLPECLCDKGQGIRSECIERAIALATSDVYEQRMQGANVLADLCAEKNAAFVSLFQSANGPSRISRLQEDPDCCIRRAVARILSQCST